MYIIILYIFVVEGINKPYENTGQKFQIEDQVGYKRLEIFELKFFDPKNKEIE